MRFLKLFLFLILICFSVKSVIAIDIPKYSGRVNDFANVFSLDFKNNLEQKLLNIESQTTDQIAVVTVKNLQGTTIEDFAEQLFQSWGIGQKDKDNGILLLVSMEDRKVRIEIGYGLESTITDGQAGEIIRNQITPEFKKGNYQQGVLLGVEKINQYLTGNITNDSPSIEKSKINNIIEVFPALAFFPIILIYLFVSYFSAFLARSSSYYLGGAVGAFGGLMAGIGSPLSIKIIFIIILGLIGLFLDFVLSKNYKKLKERGWETSFWRSGGGFGGGSSSGGGGFGGGSSGGGGASGSW